MKIQTGKGTIPFITLLAIWSVSLVVNLPGLAITPILGNIKSVFPAASELEVQLLTILPNLFIIPFVLLSGKLSESRNKVMLVAAGLAIYLVSGILYFFAKSMTALIIISSLLGIGSGIVIPIAAGFIAEYFTGKYRMKQLGIKSGIANFALVIATFAVGMLAKDGWRMPFVVYMTPLIPLLLSPFLTKRYVMKTKGVSTGSSSGNGETVTGKESMDWKKLAGIMILYGVITYAIGVINFYLPFLAEKYSISAASIGTITAVFFIAIMTPGFILPQVIKVFKMVTIPIALAFLCGGLFIGYIAREAWSLGVSAGIMGLGYGIIQPIVYDKAVEAATGRKATLALSIVLATNYFAVTAAPFIVDFFKYILHAQGNLFPYLLNSIIVGVLFAVSLFLMRRFTFSVNKDYV